MKIYFKLQSIPELKGLSEPERKEIWYASAFRSLRSFKIWFWLIVLIVAGNIIVLINNKYLGGYGIINLAANGVLVIWYGMFQQSARHQMPIIIEERAKNA